MKKFKALLLAGLLLVGTAFSTVPAFAATLEDDDEESSISEPIIVSEPPTFLRVEEIKTTTPVVKAGDTFTLNFEIKNLGQVPAKNCRAFIENIDTQTGFYHATTTPYVQVGWMYRLGVQKVNMEVKVAKETPSGVYPIKINCSAENNDTNESVPTMGNTIYITVENPNTTPDGSASLVLSKASIPEGTARPELNTDLTVEFNNISAYTAYDARITLSGFGDSVTLNSFTDTVNVGNVANNSKTSATFPISFSKTPSKTVNLVATVKYKDSTGAWVSGEPVNIFINCKQADGGEIDSGSASFTPKVIVSDYSVDVEKIESGSEFTLNFTLKNTSTQTAVKNITVKVSAFDSSTNGIGAVFTPVEGSTSFYTASIPSNSTADYSIRLKTNPTAGAKSYPVTISIDYEYEKDSNVAAGSDDTDINLAVIQPIRLELMQWYPPTECYGYDGALLYFNYYNKGKNPMTNLSISVEGDFALGAGEIYVGTLAASSYDEFNDTMYPQVEFETGDVLHAILLFKFEDASGNEHRVEYPFDVTMMEPFEPMDPEGEIDWEHVIGWDDEGKPIYDYSSTGGEASDGGLLWWHWLIIGVGGLVVIIVVIVIIVKVRKKKADSDDDDDDDE